MVGMCKSEGLQSVKERGICDPEKPTQLHNFYFIFIYLFFIIIDNSQT